MTGIINKLKQFINKKLRKLALSILSVDITLMQSENLHLKAELKQLQEDFLNPKINIVEFQDNNRHIFIKSTFILPCEIKQNIESVIEIDPRLYYRNEDFKTHIYSDVTNKLFEFLKENSKITVQKEL